jgi:hypothetical protein
LVLAPVVRILLQLSLHIVRCPKEIDKKVEEVLISKILAQFIERAYFVSQKLPNLNQRNVLIAFCTNFYENCQSRNKNIITEVKELINVLEKYFLV